jgi:hypothetical protein
MAGQGCLLMQARNGSVFSTQFIHLGSLVMAFVHPEEVEPTCMSDRSVTPLLFTVACGRAASV